MIRPLLLLPILVGACAQLPIGNRPAEPAPAPAPAPAAGAAGGTAASPAAVLSGPSTSAAALDTVSETEKEAARAAAAAAPAGGELGTVTVALGDPADPGLWVKSDLVSADTAGTVRTGGGEAIAVTLRPLGSDGGPQISLSALQALGLPLAGLHPVTLARAG